MKREFPCPLCSKPQTLECVDKHLETCITKFKQTTSHQAANDEESEYGSEYESEDDQQEQQQQSQIEKQKTDLEERKHEQPDTNK